MTVTQPTALTASVIDNGNGSATANASGGTSPYSYLWDANTGSQTTQTATGLTDGTYSVTITDANGCQTVTSILIVVSAIVDDIIVEKFEVYPNPNNGAFVVDIQLNQVQDVRISIIDVLGRELFSSLQNGDIINYPITISSYSAGVYLIRIQGDSLDMSKRIILEK